MKKVLKKLDANEDFIRIKHFDLPDLALVAEKIKLSTALKQISINLSELHSSMDISSLAQAIEENNSINEVFIKYDAANKAHEKGSYYNANKILQLTEAIKNNKNIKKLCLQLEFIDSLDEKYWDELFSVINNGFIKCFQFEISHSRQSYKSLVKALEQPNEIQYLQISNLRGGF